ncbi:MAG: hypothetical protein IKU45_04965 [Clostridia bacterium]|nr:hypothetical protein [Clostridia bacterium]
MKEFTVPEDIKCYVRKNLIKQLAKWLGFTLLVLLAIFLINVRADQLGYKKISVYITEILLILPFFITKAYKLFDKSWVGTVKKIQPDYHLEYASNGYTKWNFSHKTYTESLLLQIQMQNGNIKTYNAYKHTIAHSHEKTPSKSSPIMEHYQVGDKIIHISGTRFLQVIGKQQDETICIVCGNLEKSENKLCSQCGYTLNITENK